MSRPTMLVYSHLRWDPVCRRPRHVVSRLADSRRILFVEEPVGGAETDGWEKVGKARNLAVYRPHLRGTVEGFDPAVQDRLGRLLEALGQVEGIGRHSAWLTTPMAYPAACALAPDTIVYDAMDEDATHPACAALEARLLRHADLVLTNGTTRYRATRDRHPNVHCFPNSADVAHFRRGRAGQLTAAEYAALPRPRLGYYGTIDRRVDLAAIAALAGAHPDWSVCLVGPVEGIAVEDRPQAPNLHWFGERPYGELPEHLAAWDVTLLPYVVDDTTRYLAPTKTLEAMAAEHPIAATPLRDVAGPYEDIVYLGEGPRGFLRACEEAVASGDDERAARAERMRSIVAHTSWDHTARRIEEEIRKVEERFVHDGRTLELTIGSLLRARA